MSVGFVLHFNKSKDMLDFEAPFSVPWISRQAKTIGEPLPSSEHGSPRQAVQEFPDDREKATVAVGICYMIGKLRGIGL